MMVTKSNGAWWMVAALGLAAACSYKSAPAVMLPAPSAPPPPPVGDAKYKTRATKEVVPAPQRSFNTETYDRIHDNPFLTVAANPLSTFSIDVDTASYANVRRFLGLGQMPPPDAVRIEELLNYFTYEYPQPKDDTPFSVTTEVGACPWNPEHRLALVGLQGRRLPDAERPPRNLVFLLDVSGSMNDPAKLPLLKSAMGMLAATLTSADRVSIVVYAGRSGLVLPPTPGDRKGEILAALSQLEAGGSTAGGEGIQLAYRVAADSFLKEGVNRVILATDGDFNVGVTSVGDLTRLIEEKRKTGVFLSVLGFGSGNLKDATMEKLADTGNGNYSYIDTVHEARKVLVSEAGGTLVTIAKDVKIQVEMNPAAVSAYRLIGYENRVMRAEDFADDRKDAGEIGAGHSVTALYEIVPVGKGAGAAAPPALKYQAERARTDAGAGELMTVSVRYKQPNGDVSRLLAVPVMDPGVSLADSSNLRFAASVAGFGMLLRASEHSGHATWTQVTQMARGARGDDPHGYRGEFLRLVEAAEALQKAQPERVTSVR
jgi:Ca-activated chloride channel family protein